MLGDGGLNNNWQATISLNATADRSYSEYVRNLGNQLFDVIPAIRKRKTTETLVISFASTSMVEHLVSIGIPYGNKLAGRLTIPEWVLKSREYKIACVRGLVDTDGCLYIHNHKLNGRTYQNIGFCFTNYSPALIRQVAEIFEEYKIKPHVTSEGRRLYLYSQRAVNDYLKTFGTSNNRISDLYKKWNLGKITEKVVYSSNSR